MKVAVITICYNDDFQFSNWCKWYSEYQEDVYLHIIVDNNSKQAYLSKVKEFFKKSVIIERSSNDGTTAAYNDGLRYALSKPEVDAIMLLGQDIRLAKGCIKVLYDYLYSNQSLGMVSSPLLINDTGIVYSSGLKLNFIGEGYKLHHSLKFKNISEKEEYVDYVQGGYNLSKREFYEKVGLQDEALFMYGDELDMCMRSKKAGFRQGITTKTYAEDMDVNCPDPEVRLNRAYLASRNHVYLHKKHFSKLNMVAFVLFQFTTRTLVMLKHVFRKGTWFNYKTAILGIVDGLSQKELDNSDRTKFFYKRY